MTEVGQWAHQHIIIATTLSAWLSAQLLKVMTSYIKYRRLQWERLVGAGGMPSSHTALVVSLTTAIGLKEGVDSSVFAVSFVLAAVVMYDATGVRRAAGKQAKVINRLVHHMRVEHTLPEFNKLKELLGHTPLEVLAGAALGILVAYWFHV